VGYVVGPDSLYVAVATQPGFAFTSAEITATCRHLYRCPDSLQEKRLWQTQQGLQIMALDLEHGQVQWKSSFNDGDIGASLPLSLMPLPQKTLLVGTISHVLTALDPSSGRMLWQTEGSTPQSSVLQIAGM
jgi:outer membrane protein assembly factor BamB